MLLIILCASLFAQDTKENAEFKLAVGLYNDGMYDLAVEQFKNFIAAYPSTSQGIEARYYLGLSQMKQKHYDDARVTFQNFALTYTDHPRAPEAWLQVGDAYAATDNLREAASAYERIKVFHPKSPLVPPALVNAGNIYRRLGERDRAKALFRTTLQDYPTDKSVLRVRLILAEMYGEEGNIDLALREARHVSESSGAPELKSEALLALGRIQASASLFGDARETFTSLTTSQQQSTASLAAAYELGLLELSAGNYPAATEQFRSITRSKQAGDSLKAIALFESGICYKRQGKQAEARRNFEQFIDTYPAHALYERALLEAGRCAYMEGKSDIVGQGGKPEVALSYAKKILDLPHPEYRRQAMTLAWRACSDLRDHRNAIRYQQAYIDSFPADPVIPYTLYWLGQNVQSNLADPTKAIMLYEQLLQRFPESRYADDAMKGIAECYESMGDYQRALQTYEAMQRRFPVSTWQRVNESRMTYLKNYRIKNYDMGMKKLADITADFVSGGSKSTLAYRLGEVYFNELHDYEAAAKQFSSAIDMGLNGDTLTDAYYYRARSYHLQAAIDTSAKSRAIAAYGELLRLYPKSRWEDDAAYYMYSLDRIPNDPGGISTKMKSDFIEKYPTSRYRGWILLQNGSEAGVNNDFVNAIKLYNSALAADTSSDLIQRAELSKGEAYERLNMPDSAAASYRRAITKNPPSEYTLMAVKSLAILTSARKQFDEAIPLWKRYTSEFSINNIDDGIDRLGEAYLATGDYSDAIALYQQRLNERQLDPFNETDENDDYYSLGAAYEKQGEKERAMALYHQYLHSSPKGRHAGDAFYALGMIARTQSKSETAASYFRQAAALGGSRSATSDIAEVLFQTEQYPEAAKQYQQLAEQTDSAGQKKQYRSRAIVALLRSDRLTEAGPMIKAFDQTYSNDKSSRGELQYEEGLYYYRKQDYITAKKLFEQVADDYEETRFGPYGQFYLGKILEVTNKLDDAAKKYTDIIKRYPGSDVLPRVSLSLGNMHFNAERYEDAIRHYQHILADSQKAGEVLPYAMNNLIQAYESTKLYDDAIRVTRSFIDRYPNDESIIDKKIKLGTLFTQAGYYDQAILHFQSIMSEAGSSSEAEMHYDIGEAYYYKGDYGQAILEFLKVPYLVSKQGRVNWTATSLYMAGQSYEKMSKFEEAIGMYQQIIERPGIDATFKAGARKEIDRVKALIKKG